MLCALAVRKPPQPSHRSFPQVVYGVAVGVGTGTALGLLKIVYAWALLDMLIPAYVFALALTIPSKEL